MPALPLASPRNDLDASGRDNALDHDDDVPSSSHPDRRDLTPNERSAAPWQLRPAARANIVSAYFREMAQLDLLEPEQELAAARDIERAECRAWELALGFAPTVVSVLACIEPTLDTPAASFRTLRSAARAHNCVPTAQTTARLAEAAHTAAATIHRLDADKSHIDRVCAHLIQVSESDTELPGLGGHLAELRDARAQVVRVRNAFVRANLRLVVSIARRFNHGRMSLADLIQEGNLGLLKAVQRYDYRRGFRFSTYASWWIRHAVARALADRGREVRLPVHVLDAQHKLNKTKHDLLAKTGRPATVAELADAAAMTPEKVEQLRTSVCDHTQSLDKPVSNDDNVTLGDVLADPQADVAGPVAALTAQVVHAELHRLVAGLSPLEEDILRLRFGMHGAEEHTLKEIGEIHNLSRERVRQIQLFTLAKLRRILSHKRMT